MRYPPEQAAANRGRIVERAAELYRQQGFVGVGVADLMKAVGLTHGGFYRHFASKEALLAEASGHALAQTADRLERKLADSGPGRGLAAWIDDYLSRQHVERPELGCAVAALGPEAAREGPVVRHAFEEGIARLLDDLARASLPDGRPLGRARAVATFAQLVGALVLARSTENSDLADEALATVKADLVARLGL